MSELSQEFLKEHLEYRDGHLWWIKPTARRVSIGDRFGSYHSNGYRVGRLKNKPHYEHRLIWLYHRGIWPKGHIDHINNIRDDNRIENLREATIQQNQFNKKSVSGSSSKYKGVCWDKKRKKWRANATLDGKIKTLGRFNCEHEAAESYRKATEHLHKEYANYD